MKVISVKVAEPNFEEKKNTHGVLVEYERLDGTKQTIEYRKGFNKLTAQFIAKSILYITEFKVCEWSYTSTVSADNSHVLSLAATLGYEVVQLLYIENYDGDGGHKIYLLKAKEIHNG